MILAYSPVIRGFALIEFGFGGEQGRVAVVVRLAFHVLGCRCNGERGGGGGFGGKSRAQIVDNVALFLSPAVKRGRALNSKPS